MLLVVRVLGVWVSRRVRYGVTTGRASWLAPLKVPQAVVLMTPPSVAVCCGHVLTLLCSAFFRW